MYMYFISNIIQLPILYHYWTIPLKVVFVSYIIICRILGGGVLKRNKIKVKWTTLSLWDPHDVLYLGDTAVPW